MRAVLVSGLCVGMCGLCVGGGTALAADRTKTETATFVFTMGCAKNSMVGQRTTLNGKTSAKVWLVDEDTCKGTRTQGPAEVVPVSGVIGSLAAGSITVGYSSTSNQCDVAVGGRSSDLNTSLDVKPPRVLTKSTVKERQGTVTGTGAYTQCTLSSGDTVVTKF